MVRTAAVIVTWEGGATTDRRVASLLAQDAPPDEIVAVDNASSGAERERLEAGVGRQPHVRLLMPDNRQFAGGLNAGGREAFARGAERMLFLNNDAVLDAGALGLLGAALDAHPEAGVVGPLVCYLGARAQFLTAGEVHSLPLLCVPRSLLRPRRGGRQPYPVSGVMGCAMLATRACFEAVGGYSEEIEVYYEDVDFCVGARAAGFRLLVEPRAVVHHDGFRGFVRGLTPWAGFLKARNPWILMRRRAGIGSWITFLPSYPVMIGASAVLYAVRGRGDIARAMLRGAWAGLRAALGAGRRPVGAPG